MPLAILVVGNVAAIVLAWALVSKRHEHRPIAALLTLMLGINVAQFLLEGIVLAPLRASLGMAQPWTGWAWAASLLHNALDLVWPAAILGAALVVFAGRRPWPSVAAWLLGVVLYAGLHPLASDGSQARFHGLASMLACLGSGALATLYYLRRTERTEPAAHVLSVIVGAELLMIPGTLHVGPFQSWSPEMIYLVAFGALVLMQAYAAMQRVAAVERRQDITDRGTLRANVIAAAAVRMAERAEGMATEARDLADNIPPPPSTRSPPTPT